MTIITLTLLILIIAIVYNQYKHKYNKRKQRHEIDQQLMRSIEAKVLKTVKEKAEYWDNFNIALYVEYLEATQ